MKIAIRRGHQRTGADGCASGIVNEITVAEDYKNRLITKFKALGHQVLDCTPPEANRSLSDSLWYGINKANNWGADVFVSCHVNNAYDTTYNGVIGCEVLYYRNSSTGKNYARNIEAQLSSLGFKSRGAKADVRGLAEINNTVMPCVIVEPFFVEAIGDISTYKRVGGEGIANAIVKGLVGRTTSATTSHSSSTSTNSTNSSSYPLLRKGSRGSYVTKLQSMLIKIGYPVGSYGADGVFGNGTLTAVRAFQRDCGLGVDGIVGNNTWKALKRNMR